MIAPPTFTFPAVGQRSVNARFDGGNITSDAGLLLVREADRQSGLTSALAGALRDRRQAAKVEHSLWKLVASRVYAILMGYEDVNDLDTLRHDPALKTACGLPPGDLSGLASQPTVSRFENSVRRADLYRMAVALARSVIARLPADTNRVVLDIDATDDPCHGEQQLRLFDGHYDCVCYTPLHLYISDQTGRMRLLAAVLRSANSNSKRGVLGLLKRAVALVRERFPEIEVEVRGDCGFGYGALLNWGDANRVDYTLGFQHTKPLIAMTSKVQIRAALLHRVEGDGCRIYGETPYKGETWHRQRRIVVKAEASADRVDARFVVTSDNKATPEVVYAHYTQRGNCENRIKEMKLDMRSGRTSCHRFLANQCRLLLHASAYILMGYLQEGLQGTQWAQAQAATVRLRLLKVGGRVVQTCRNVWFHLSTAFPDKEAWQMLHQQLTRPMLAAT